MFKPYIYRTSISIVVDSGKAGAYSWYSQKYVYTLIEIFWRIPTS